MRSPVSKHILMELEWQTQKAKETETLYIIETQCKYILMYNKIQMNDSCLMWHASMAAAWEPERPVSH